MAAAQGEYRLQALRDGKLSRINDEARLREVAKEFETMLVEMMVKSMR
nr:hypothetical protein [Gammaproteobacteria bacterium]